MVTQPTSPSILPATRVRTFLIADLRGYTQFTFERGDEAAASLADRFAVAANLVVGRHSGELVELRGDEAVAVFDSPREALRAAVELQSRLKREREAEPELPLRAGVGVDAGEAIPVQGGYRTGALILASRLCSIAASGEVFASETVIALARTLDGFVYVDRGKTSLKGFPQPVRVIQVVPHGEVPAQASPFSAHATPEIRLPVQLTPFIGRGRERGEITAMLRRDDVRLLTLIGPGGTGKTRLAIQTAAEVGDAFPDGIYFVSLAPLTDARLVAASIGGALRIVEQSDGTDVDALIRSLDTKNMLLVLDNFEHVLPAADTVHRLLAHCPGVTVMATSRAPLQLSSERSYPVSPLALPDPNRLPTIDTIAGFDAVALFVERARAVQPDFAVTSENAAAIVEISHRLDGLPLAIELAAARIRLFPPQALLGKLDDSLNVLTGGGRDRPDRHQTLRNTIAWSYDLLSEEERALFSRLSVFAGGCSLEAAQAVGSMGELELLEGIGSLVDKCLIQQVGEMEARYQMLDTVRAYAAEKLEERGEADATRERHAQYFLRLSTRLSQELGIQRHGEWLDRMEAELDNLRAALDWAMAGGQVLLGLRLLGLQLYTGLGVFWYRHGHLAEGLERARKLLLEGINQAATADNRRMMLHAVEAMAQVALDEGRGEDAARLAGAAEEARERLGIRISAGHAARLQDLAVRGRSTLGDDRWEQTLASGREMRFDDAVALARECAQG